MLQPASAQDAQRVRRRWGAHDERRATLRPLQSVAQHRSPLAQGLRDVVRQLAARHDTGGVAAREAALRRCLDDAAPRERGTLPSEVFWRRRRDCAGGWPARVRGLSHVRGPGAATRRASRLSRRPRHRDADPLSDADSPQHGGARVGLCDRQLSGYGESSENNREPARVSGAHARRSGPCVRRGHRVLPQPVRGRSGMKVSFSYLDRQFADVDGYLNDVRALVLSGKFTLGAAVERFENAFAQLCGMPHAIGVGSGTDALILSLEMLGVGPGDEVITAANTFIATVGAIAMTGARPVFVDSDETFTMNPSLVEAAITSRTTAILPVHYTGQPANMPAIATIAEQHGLRIVEDACQAISARYDNLPVGSWGDTAGFSLHPLKNLNVWGDGGVIVTRSAELAGKLRLFRNHGLSNRDEVLMFGHNSRLDALQAVVGSRLIAEAPSITERRIANAAAPDATPRARAAGAHAA